MELRRVVVTGLGTLTPVGNDVPAMWDSLKRGVSGGAVITYFNPEKFKCHIACELKGYDVTKHFDRKQANRLDLFSQYAQVAVHEALTDSGLLDYTELDKRQVGVIIGSGFGGVNTFQQECWGYLEGGRIPRFSPFFVPKTIIDVCPGQVAIKYGFEGPNYSTVAACASSAVSIGEAFNTIRLGKAKVMITGGTEAAVTECGIGGFGSTQALSTRNDDPKTASRPFDKGRDGFVLGEGAGALILEDYEHAKARGARIYAEITGWGSTADAYHITASHPEGLGAANAMKMAVAESGMALDDVDYINTHGTSTPKGDISEPRAIENLFGAHAKDISLDSTKSMMGHLLGAAGAVEAVATVLSIYNNFVPPTINHFEDDPEIPSLDYTFNEGRAREVNFALSNAFGFGGHNVCLAFLKCR